MAKQSTSEPAMQLQDNMDYRANVQTNKGDFTIELLASQAPKTVNNFVSLTREGYFDGIIFHRIIETFMIQTGDPTGTGMGGPGYRFADELPPALPYALGVVAMANAGPNTNGSQFFVCTGESSKHLNTQPNYTVFGRVVEGMDTIMAIAKTPVGRSNSGESSQPKEEVKMIKVTIAETPVSA